MQKCQRKEDSVITALENLCLVSVRTYVCTNSLQRKRN